MLFSKKKMEEVVEKSTTKREQDGLIEVNLKVLGSGCAKCNQLEQAALQALEELKMNATVEHVTDYAKIASYGVMSTPALVINEVLISSGKVLSVKQIVELIQKNVSV
jgi:small redox-active disulfide protein 2